MADDSKFCTKCGTSLTIEAIPQSSVVKKFEENPQLQEHWIKRLVAYVIDSIIVGIATGILLAIALFPIFIGNPFGFLDILSFPFAMGAFAVIYFSIAETMYGTTFGKSLLGLKIVSTADKKISIEKAFIRNISKIHPVLLFLDLIGGLITSKDLHQKYSDRIANTTVA